MAPGDTPPIEASATEGLAHHETAPSRAVPAVALIALGVLVLLIIGFFVARAIDLL